MTDEGRVQSGILNYLEWLEKKGYPIYYEKRQAGGFSYKKGLPDIYGIFNGIHFEVEVKRPGGSRSAMQEKWEERFKRINVHYTCSYSVDTFKDWFNETFLETYNKK